MQDKRNWRSKMDKGVIKTKIRNWGFIKTENGKEIFFHETGLKNTSFKLLKRGAVVEFKTVQTPKGPKAVNIEVKEKKKG